MIFGEIVLAGMVGCAAYLQASSGGWKMLATSFLLIVFGIGGIAFLLLQTEMPLMDALKTNADGLRLKSIASAALAMIGTTVFVGAGIGAVFQGEASAGKLGGYAFVVSLVAITAYSIIR